MVNVDPQQRSTRYVSNSDGAPPLPPQGGYKGAARPRGIGQALSDGGAASIDVPGAPARLPNSVFGWITIGLVSAFALVLVAVLAFGKVDTIFSLTALAVQCVVIGVIIAAFFSPGARRLATISVAVALVFNVATIGAVSSSSTAIAGNYEGHKSEEEKLWESYPGLKSTPADTILSQPSLEEVQTEQAKILQAIRTELSNTYGYTWAAPTQAELSPVRNGYGGESMLQSSISEQWTTNEVIRGQSRKLAVMDTIDDVITSYRMDKLYPLNDPRSGLAIDMIEKLYGGRTIDTQPIWEWYAYDRSGISRIYVNVYDLSIDNIGNVTDSRNAAHQRTGEPVEGLQLTFHSDALLSEQDRAEFEKQIQKYP